MFQSTHAHGVRHSGIISLSFITKVSIHARTRRATDKFGLAEPIVMFQSTHAHGVRQYGERKGRYKKCFNPRTHTACDLE